MQNNPDYIFDKNNHKYLIKIATTKDSKRLMDYYRKLSDKTSKLFHPHEFNIISLQKILSKKNNIRLILEGKKNEVIGYTFLSHVPFLNKTGYFGIGLADKYQGKGLGKNFMLKLFDIGSHTGFSKVILNVYTDNQGAIELYKGQGFRIFRPSKIFEYLIIMNEILMNESLILLFKKLISMNNLKRGKSHASIWMKSRI
jgi:ribosomal protein S18 acetylase RimI-like enzyme